MRPDILVVGNFGALHLVEIVDSSVNVTSMGSKMNNEDINYIDEDVGEYIAITCNLIYINQ